MPRIVNLSNLQTFTAVNALNTDLGNVPGPVVIPSCAQIVLNWSLADGKAGHNVIYGRYTGGFAGTVSQATAIHTALSTGAQWTAMAAYLTTTTILQSVTIRNVAVQDQPLIASTSTAAPGTGAGLGLPTETAVCVTERTALTGRSNRGRVYLPGMVATAVGAGDTIPNAVMTAITNWAGTLLSALAASGYALVIGQKQRGAYTSPITGRAFPARAANSVPVTSLLVRDNHWDSQRRRGLK
jgi:hypothetical protein